MTTTLNASPELIQLKFDRILLIEELHMLRESRDRNEITLEEVNSKLSRFYPYLVMLNHRIDVAEGKPQTIPAKLSLWKKLFLSK